MRFLAVFLSVFFALSTSAFAQVTVHIANTVTGKTFWQEDRPERYYFGKDGQFLLQYTQGEDKNKTGTVREGQWLEKSGVLCWTLKDDGSEHCYTLLSDMSGQKLWGKFDESYRLIGADRGREISWDRWMYGSMITKPSVYQSIDKKINPPFDSDRYRAAIVGKIMRLPMGYVYHDADGTLYSIEEKNVEQVRKNSQKLKDDSFLKQYNINKFSWTLEGNRHCWVYNSGKSTCNTLIEGSDLYSPQDGYVHLMDDNFIRLITPSDLLSVN